MTNSSQDRWFQKYPRVAFTLLLIIIVLIVDFLTALIFIPIDYNAFRTPHPVYHHDLLPNQQTQNSWGNRVFDVYTNSLGFKDGRVREVSSKAEKKRILFIGDSFTEGVGMTWPESVAGILDQEYSDIEILNAGVVSYSPKFYFLKTKYLIEEVQLEFDELFVFIDNSDPLNEITYKSFIPYKDNSIKIFFIGLKRYLYKNSYLYYSISNIIQKSMRNPATEQWNRKSGMAFVEETDRETTDFISATPVWSLHNDLYEKWGKEGLMLAAKYMQELYDLCKQNQIKLKIAIYPWPSIISKRDLKNLQVDFWSSFCKKNDIEFIDLYPAFINSTPTDQIIRDFFIPGDVHWNQKGNSYVAKQLKPFISK